MITIVRVAVAALLLVPTAGQIGGVPDVGAWVLFAALVLTVLFGTTLFRTRTERDGGV
ncbi:hypothetical protein [Actinokineospora pegani]|uniref:hypothetical protein n=1 Tax=Actinokineospora pegani TaxID=2654637 RepID=UPI0012EADAE1|nr:hypothetical protein [Actinokineospora pegani]